MTRMLAKNEGFALIITVMILSAVLGLVIVSVSSITHVSRTAVAEEVFKAESSRAAESCAKLVLLRLRNAQNFSGNVGWAISEYSCEVGEIFSSGNQVRHFEVKVGIQNVISEFKVEAGLDPFQIINIIQTY